MTYPYSEDDDYDGSFRDDYGRKPTKETEYYRSNDINDCRDWLRQNGLKFLGSPGFSWESDDGRIGAVDFCKGEWVAYIIYPKEK